MAHFSDMKNESDVSKINVPRGCRNDGFFVKTDLYGEPGGADRLRSLFDQVLSYFLKGVSVTKDVIRAFPPKLGDDVEVDLFTLFWVVTKIGNYELVTKNESWEFVAQECGLDIKHVGSLKLIYNKYLKELDQWLSRGCFNDTKLEDGELGVLEKLGSLFRKLSSVGSENHKGKCVCIECSDDGGNKSGYAMKFNKKLDLDMAKTEKRFPRINNVAENDEEFGDLDLNIAKSEMGFSRINNVDEKDENSGGFDVDMPKSEMGFSIINNVDEKEEKSGGLDLDMAKSEMGLSRIDYVKEKDEEFGCLDLDMAKTELGLSRINNVDEKDENFGVSDVKRTESLPEIIVKKVDVSTIKDDDDKRAVLCPMSVLGFRSNNNVHNDTNDHNTMIFAKNIVGNVVNSQKREKEESLLLSKMLHWVTDAARNPHDLTIGSIPNSSKWKKYKNNVVWKQVLLVKDTLFAKRNVDPGNKVYGSQKKRHMMHPSMYEDDKIPIHLSSKRIRCSQRVSSVKACSCPGCMSCSSSRNKRPKPDVKKSPQIPEIIEIEDVVCEDLEMEIVPVGAKVPEWTGVVSESDPKWLGTRMWPPPEDNNGKQERDLLVIGKGRSSSCACSSPGSADCVRLHIAKNRRRVRKTLGPLFYKWKFNHMGEDASLCLWSLEEESEFKCLVIKARQELTDKSKSRHEIMSNFWKRASESIPFKTKDLLVSYYFNVFVLRRRRYQNRIMPENIDSDDDEQEVGYEKIHALSIKCSKDTRCTDVKS